MLVLIGLSAALLATEAGSLPPLEPGRYCLRRPLVGDTGRGTIPLGEFWMSVEVARRGGRYTVGFANGMPDSGEILTGGPEPATVMADGSLSFAFTDGWGNAGEGRIDPAAIIHLEIVRQAPDGANIGRNYGTYELNRADCAGLARPLD